VLDPRFLHVSYSWFFYRRNRLCISYLLVSLVSQEFELFDINRELVHLATCSLLHLGGGLWVPRWNYIYLNADWNQVYCFCSARPDEETCNCWLGSWMDEYPRFVVLSMPFFIRQSLREGQIMGLSSTEFGLLSKFLLFNLTIHELY
jgi:hypothetical protein